ncbi:MAG TPA: hypothetical protein VK421_06210 [Pyrinomonadaceae bacterium]|nr:hypothetical protein [Pyrinomonadaceae bacterium]
MPFTDSGDGLRAEIKSNGYVFAPLAALGCGSYRVVSFGFRRLFSPRLFNPLEGVKGDAVFDVQDVQIGKSRSEEGFAVAHIRDGKGESLTPVRLELLTSDGSVSKPRLNAPQDFGDAVGEDDADDADAFPRGRLNADVALTVGEAREVGGEGFISEVAEIKGCHTKHFTTSEHTVFDYLAVAVPCARWIGERLVQVCGAARAGIRA